MLKVGTDCSGIEAPIQALLQLGIPFKHEFSSDIDKWCIQSIRANYSPKTIFGDITKRDVCTVPKVDLYVCGFPCQPFSIAGDRKGLADPRGTVVWSCIQLIKTQQPKYFVLENVKGLLSHQSGETWKVILELLGSLTGYTIKYKILNTKDYGIPQNRERLFIVGILGENVPFEFPEPIPLEKKISQYVDYTVKEKDPLRNDVALSGMLDKIPKDAVFVDFAFKKYNYPYSGVYAPCIAADSRTWCVELHRYATPKERLALQGFPTDFKQVVSNTQFKKQIGNSMSVCVLKAIFKVLLK